MSFLECSSVKHLQFQFYSTTAVIPLSILHFALCILHSQPTRQIKHFRYSPSKHVALTG